MSATLEGGHQCAGKIRLGTSWPRYVPCKRPGKVQSDGKWWCGIHDPQARQAKQDKRDAEWKAKVEADRKVMRLQFSAPTLLSALKEALPWLEQRGNEDIVVKVKAAIREAEE